MSPMMWQVSVRPVHDSPPTAGEPFATYYDDEGELMMVLKEQIEVPFDPSKATEVIGTLAVMPPPSPPPPPTSDG